MFYITTSYCIIWAFTAWFLMFWLCRDDELTLGDVVAYVIGSGAWPFLCLMFLCVWLDETAVGRAIFEIPARLTRIKLRLRKDRR